MKKLICLISCEDKMPEQIAEEAKQAIEKYNQTLEKVSEKLPPMSIEEFLQSPLVEETTQPGTAMQITGYPHEKL